MTFMFDASLPSALVTTNSGSRSPSSATISAMALDGTAFSPTGEGLVGSSPMSTRALELGHHGLAGRSAAGP
jgi:hypothetical protein